MKPWQGINTEASLVGPATLGNSAERHAGSGADPRSNRVHANAGTTAARSGYLAGDPPRPPLATGVEINVEAKPPRLLDQVRARMRRLGLAIRSEEAYVGWIRRFILANGKRHPRELGAIEVEAFLTDLAVRGQVAASTQNQALSALLFLYREVLVIELPWLDNIRRAKRPERLPTVLSREETRALLAELTGVCWLQASLLYGSGLRLLECLRLRVQDIDFTRREVMVRHGKGGKDRRTMLPTSLEASLRGQMAEAQRLHERDLELGFGAVWLPDALARKYPNAPREWAWQYVFPASQRSIDPRSGIERRHHLDESVLQRAVKAAARRAGLSKPATCHTLRHSFATHLLEGGYDIRTIAAPAHPCARGIGTSLCGTGTTWACRCFDDDDLYPCVEQGWARGVKSAGSLMGGGCAAGVAMARPLW